MSEGLNKIKTCEREVLQNLLDQCTPKQQIFFKRMYPEGIDKMNSQSIHRAIQQCEATIVRNEMKL